MPSRGWLWLRLYCEHAVWVSSPLAGLQDPSFRDPAWCAASQVVYEVDLLLGRLWAGLRPMRISSFVGSPKSLSFLGEVEPGVLANVQCVWDRVRA